MDGVVKIPDVIYARPRQTQTRHDVSMMGLLVIAGY